jgi:ribosome-associated protein
MIPITDTISIDEREIEERFVRSSGPGGQNVNKVATAVQLRFDAVRSLALHPEMLARLVRLAGKRLTGEGILIITAQRYRTQERNREDALSRLVALLRDAAVEPRKRVPTRPTVASKRRRRETKARRARLKAQRSAPVKGED